MSQIVDCSEFCRLCLVKEQVNTPIFEEDGGYHQLSTKISTCLPVKVSREDSLPKRICDGCCYKVEQQYQFWNISLNAEKQFKQWLGISEDTETAKQNVNKIKKESTYDGPSASKRPKRNARRKAVQNIRQATAAQQSDSDSDIPLAARTVAPSIEVEPIAKDENDSDHHDFPEDNDSMDPPNFVNMNLEGEQDQAGPSGLQKAESTEPVEAAPATLNMEIEAGEGNLFGNFKNVIVKTDPGEFEPLVTITELPLKANQGRSSKQNRNLSDSEDDHLLLAKLELTKKEGKISSAVKSRKKTSSKNVSSKKKTKDADNDEEYKPHKKIKSKPKIKEEPIETKIKEEPQDEEDENDEYQNPFNYGFDIPQKTARKRKPFNKPTVNTEARTKVKSKWSCLICLADMASKDALIAHYAIHKNDPIKQENDTEPRNTGTHFMLSSPSSNTNSTANNLYLCQLCGKSCESEKMLKKHSEVHIEECFHCEICNKVFKRAYEYSVHSRIHNNEPKLKCDLCDYETIYQSALKTHIQRHEANYKYKCDICNKGFFAQTWYEEHKNFHTGAKPFVCDICDKPFAYTRYLTAHKRSMHPESYRDEPVINECDICQKRFAHKKSLMLHMRGHTGENTVLCDICGKRLSSNEHLKFHRRIHTGYKPYTCDVCSKGFAKKCNLTLHLRVHSGEKPYICDVCGKCFSQRSTLVIHERYHTGQRPYTCHLCHKGFVAKGVLSIHLKSCSKHTIMGGAGLLE